ncbi:MAG TPA: GLPGLI family protein [Flavobacteriaceae bacterium]|nr:GLPGLI family protein [Flavobacteriaceae bacterium]
MKKTTFLIALFSILLSYSLPAQVKGEASYQVKYEVNFAIDSTDRGERTIEMHNLYTGNSVSYYVSDVFIALDSMMTQFRENPQAGMRRMSGNFQDMPRPEFLARVYKDLKDNETWVTAAVLRDRYLYEETDIPVVWKMTEETKEIGEYSAQKATTHFGGRDWTAWFTFQVPIQDGPYVFSGLPGLILELSDTDEDYQFNVTSIKPLEEKYEIELKTDKLKNLSKKEFIKAYENFRENPLGQFADRIRQMDMKFPDPTTGDMISGSEFIRRAKQEVARRNNYIERW